MRFSFTINRATLLFLTWLFGVGYCVLGMFANMKLNIYYTVLGVNNILWSIWIILITFIAIWLIGKSANNDKK